MNRLALLFFVAVSLLSSSGCRTVVVDRHRPVGLDAVDPPIGEVRVGYANGRSAEQLELAGADHRTGIAIAEELRELRELGRATRPESGRSVLVRVLRVPPPRLGLAKMISGLSLGLIPITARDTYLVRIDPAASRGPRVATPLDETTTEDLLIVEAEETLDPALIPLGSVTTRTWIWSPLFIGRLFSRESDPLARQIDAWLTGEE